MSNKELEVRAIIEAGEFCANVYHHNKIDLLEDTYYCRKLASRGLRYVFGKIRK